MNIALIDHDGMSSLVTELSVPLLMTRTRWSSTVTVNDLASQLYLTNTSTADKYFQSVTVGDTKIIFI